MLIGQLSKLSGFSKDTIRYYEKIALIVLPKRKTGSSKYKDYPEDILHLLNAIRKYKELGFKLEEIRELIVLQSIRVLDISKLLQLVEHKLNGIDAEIDRLHAIKLQLNREHQLLLRKKTGHIIALPEMRMAA
ncbi:MAG: MerR family transcriptional regulator [Bacteroidetes bacterium]|nr:MerR family transcriptional regulator [Bacteroidota bacterium]